MTTTSRRTFHLSLSGLSIAFALGLALWEWYFKDWAALDRDNTRIWNSYYRPKPLFDHLPTWQDWLPEYR